MYFMYIDRVCYKNKNTIYKENNKEERHGEKTLPSMELDAYTTITH